MHGCLNTQCVTFQKQWNDGLSSAYDVLCLVTGWVMERVVIEKRPSYGNTVAVYAVSKEDFDKYNGDLSILILIAGMHVEVIHA